MEKFYEKFYNDASTQFLNPTNTFSSIALSVFPGVDDYMVRYLLECITGITTGSDTQLEDYNFNIFKGRNFKGEGVVNSTTWIKKTSFPENKGQEFQGFKCILVVKNPFDLLRDNFAQKIAETKTHISMSLINSNEQIFSAYITKELENIHSFYEFWMEAPIPVFILRYEDLIFDPENILISLFQFLYEFPSLKGTKIENKILGFLKYNKNYTNMLETFINSYEPGIQTFTSLQKNIVLKYFKDYVWKFGYLNEGFFEKLRSKNSYSEPELSSLLEDVGTKNFEHNKFYKDYNAQIVKKILDNLEKPSKYRTKISITINPK